MVAYRNGSSDEVASGETGSIVSTWQFSTGQPQFPYNVDEDFLHKLFGTDHFCIYHDDDEDFCKFSVRDWFTVGVINLYHGMTLGELHSLLHTRVWTAGHYTPPSVSSPLAIWGCSTLGGGLNKAQAKRGWAHNHQEWPTAWDCPVVLGMSNRSESGYGKHGRTKRSGTVVQRDRVDTRTVPFESLNIVTVFIPRGMYYRFEELSTFWPLFQSGEAVLCRTKHKQPEDFFDSGGHGAPWSCGRWVRYDDRLKCQWIKAGKTKQWRCPTCDRNCYEHLSVAGV